VDVRVDEPGHHRAAAEVDRPRIGRDRDLFSHRMDAPVAQRHHRGDHTAAVDEFAVDENNVAVPRPGGAGGGQLLCRGRAAARCYPHGASHRASKPFATGDVVHGPSTFSDIPLLFRPPFGSFVRPMVA
jgi:hypothetical protein